jgi:cation diffusion facilitator CzcD-associated flavoprotein CzcO
MPTDAAESPNEIRPALIVGAGPAGLAIARAMGARGLAYDHVERHSGLGGIWDIDAAGSPMYEAAHLISSRTLSGFPGFPMADDLPDYPSHRQVLGYLRDFAAAYRLDERIEFGKAVEEVVLEPAGSWSVRFVDGERRRYADLVCASGTQWTPNLPQTPGDFAGTILHSSEYRDIDQVRGRRVLVVGGGNSACDIVVDASRVATSAVLSLRRGYWFIPKHIFGMPADVFAESGPRLPTKLQQVAFQKMLTMLYGRPERLGLPTPDHKLFETHPVLNTNLFHALQHGNVRSRPAIGSVEGHTIRFVDGAQEDFDTIVYATGFLHSVPYAQAYVGPEQHPDMYLSVFSREHEGLFCVGFQETNSGAYRHFDGVAQMVASHLEDREQRPERYVRFRELILADRPDLSGGIRFDRSARHAAYVDSDAFTRFRAKLMRRMGWTAHHALQAG